MTVGLTCQSKINTRVYESHHIVDIVEFLVGQVDVFVCQRCAARFTSPGDFTQWIASTDVTTEILQEYGRMERQ